MRALFATLIATGIADCSTVLIDPDFETGRTREGEWNIGLITGARPWFRSSSGVPPGGQWHAAIVSHTEGSIGQSFLPILGSDVVEFSFWAFQDPAATISIELFYADGSTSGETTISPFISDTWTFVQATPLIEADREFSGFRITKLGEGVSGLDNFELMTVPESRSATLTLIGATVIIGKRSRTRRRSEARSERRQ